MNSYQKTIILLIGFLLGSCAASKNATLIPYDLDCPQLGSSFSSYWVPMDEVLDNATLISNYSTPSLVIANAYGLIDDLEDLNNIKDELIDRSSDSISIELLSKLREMDRVLEIADLELESFVNFIDCNTLSLVRIKSDLTGENNKTRTSLTNWALIVGVAGAVIVAGVVISDNNELKNGDAIDWIGIGAALAGGYLAVRSDRVNRSVSLIHQDNMIGEIWSGNNESEVFPNTVWELLNQERFIDSAKVSMRSQIIKTWKESKSMLGNNNKMDQISVLIEPGGNYNEDMLQLRIDMLNEIKHSIERISRALFRLNLELE